MRTIPWWYYIQLIVLGLLFFGALGSTLVLSLTEGTGLAEGGFSFAAYWELFTNARVGTAFLNSLQLALLTAVVAVPLATLTARLLLSLSSPTWRFLLGGMVLLPLLSSSILRMFGYGMLLSEGGPFRWLLCLGAASGECQSILYSKAAIIIGLVSNVLPFCFLIIFVQLIRIRSEEIYAARNLGASAWDIWWLIEVPHCKGGIIMSAQLCILMVFGDLLAQSILGGGTTYTYAAAIYDRTKINEWASAAAMAMVLVLVASVLIGTAIWLIVSPQSARHPKNTGGGTS